jgi:hypothetical protein
MFTCPKSSFCHNSLKIAAFEDNGEFTVVSLRRACFSMRLMKISALGEDA